ncbi:TPA: aminoglycoside O-phosphotransferase APH(9)-Ia [Legionella pneumophila subsp. pneumophila]|uniref:Spectinomycin phosphotransferase n=1 Tax=Legionella pneumophila (strain Lens) TaxID=297245 RepID=Q5WWB8_LEGPL|nr:aminoglycoside O-phosphotransferase APH(9)-Ia [Legionella pneumophila]AOW51883.1 spectinomycin phosphotransferase [Legionella pneumophila subsp. pneumophila]AOW54522.1 spectinomycin phosphotransferase [Legionella pneumophila subsp. pneumophila]AOW57180.1 spectinomycin phosphotransferase [Legionella pneumophila subsp. pneumophila]AOW59892.1 spectinomycin phosphotransferase [Legionella pneumophila subsp. pneumophila]AOW62677.1 spectinomycin phosphotransferase [Legionella pneumophila subsp. pn
MLRNNIPDQHLIALLKVYYGIDIHTVQLIVGGADMNAFGYKADSESNSYFVKLKYGHHDEINLSIIRLLHDSGIKEIIFPIYTRDTKLFQQIDHFKIIVYPFINAPNGFTQNLTEKQWHQLGKVLRQIHETSVPTAIQQRLRKETYSPKWREMVRSFYNKIGFDDSDDQITTDFKTFFNQNIDSIHRLVDSSEELSKKIQPDLDKYVLCHSDVHAGNVLVVNEESIYIIDWDEPMLAPKECDLMFIGGGIGNVWNKHHEINYFYEGYGKTNVDKIILSYYRHERIVEDIAVYGQDLLSRDQNDESRLESFKHFKSMFTPNDVVEIAFSSD